MQLTNQQKKLLLLPIALIISTITVSSLASRYLSLPYAFLTCFLLYWFVWCYAVPIYFIGFQKIKSLYKVDLPSPKWIAVLLILMPFVGTISQIFIPEFSHLTSSIILVTIIAAIINGPGEELFWRGLFTSIFPNNYWLAIVYPSIFFGLWHFAPLSVSGLHEGWQLIVFGPMILGLCWGWVAYKSKSILWISIAHILVNCFALIGRMFLI